MVFFVFRFSANKKINRKSKYICDFFSAISKTFFSLKFYASIIVIIQFKKKTIFFSGQSSTVNEEYIFPIYTASSEDCNIVLEFNSMSFTRKALQVTMTTNYNETYNSVLDEIPFVKPLKQYLNLNASKGL